MKIVWSGESQTPNLWRPEQFVEEWRQLADEAEAIGARRVFVCTVPHITILPLTRGVTVNGDALIDGYYEFYTFFWVWDSAFKRDPRNFPRLSREEARLIDRTIDQYNDTIRADAAERGWHVVAIDEMLDALAFRRSEGKPRYVFPPKLVAAVAQNPDAQGRVSNGKLSLDTRFLRLDLGNAQPQERYKGGIFSLDGAHPSTIGYGLVAHEILKVMKRAWQDERPEWQAFEIDWPHVVQADTLLTKPPGNLGHLQDTLSLLYNFTPLREVVSLL